MSDKPLGAECIGTVKSLVRDPVGNRLWLYTTSSLYQILLSKKIVTCGSCILTRLRVATEESLSLHISTQNQLRKEVVRSAQADFYFNRQEYVMSAKYYATTSRSFEEIALKFAGGDTEEKALKAFVLAKLRSLRPDQKYTAYDFILWVVEMFLSQLNDLDSREDGNASSNKSDGDTLSGVQEEFKAFLKENRAHLGMSECAETTFQMISSHGRIDMLLYFADLIEDYERMMTLYVQEENYNDAVSFAAP